MKTIRDAAGTVKSWWKGMFEAKQKKKAVEEYNWRAEMNKRRQDAFKGR